MLASGSTESCISLAASSTSCIPISLPPVKLISTPLAPVIDTSSSGESIACLTASTALVSPVPWPIPISALPASCIIDFTSAKSRLTIPLIVIRSAIPCTPCFKISSTAPKASRSEVLRSIICKILSLGIIISVSTLSFISSIPWSDTFRRLSPSKVKGFVIIATVSAPISLAMRATTGAAPEPVPPPDP